MSFDSEILHDPYRVAVTKNGEWVATFTPDCYTVITAGPERVFTEKFQRGGETVEVRVGHRTWVRAAPGPVDTKIDKRWLCLALDANQRHVPDALAIAMQYLKGSPPVLFGDLQISGDASYGPRQEEGSDFNDYVGIRWLYPNDPPDEPEPNQLRCLDCSGFMRMVWGYRHHLPGSGYLDSVPLSLRPKNGSALPRRAVEMYQCAPGLILAADNGSQLEDFEHIDIGDLVFFDGSDDDGDDIDHVGMYLGTDTGGHHRFISSRKTPDGPTFADYGGSSVLDGAGHYAKAFRAIRRL
jgi:cell wall-associated NlpC family hydrolase